MAIRAEQVLMAGVVGLGLYALYRLSRTEGAGDQTPSQAGQGKNASPRIDPSLPDAPSVIVVPANVQFVTGDPNRPAASMHLVNGIAYRGRGENVTERDLGFLDAVRFYTNPTDAKAGGFPDWALAGASKNTRWFYGRYLYPDKTYARPSSIGLLFDDRWLRAPVRPAATAGAPYVHVAPVRGFAPRILF